jgi:hypothetical protein
MRLKGPGAITDRGISDAQLCDSPGYPRNPFMLSCMARIMQQRQEVPLEDVQRCICAVVGGNFASSRISVTVSTFSAGSLACILLMQATKPKL